MNNEKSIRYDSLDWLKGMACLAVVFIHYPFAGADVPLVLSNSFKAAMRFAVPVFFAVAGFFCVTDDGLPVSLSKIKSKFSHILRIYLFSGLFYFVFDAILFRSGFPSYLASSLTLSRAVKWVLISCPFFKLHLWFLIALMACYATIMIVRLRFKAYWTLSASIGLMALFLLMQEFGVIPSRVLGRFGGMNVFNNYVFRAAPFFLFGIACRGLLPRIQSINCRRQLFTWIMLCGCGLAALERFLFNASQFYVGSNIAFMAMFVSALKWPNGYNPFLVYVGKHLSLYVYVLHIAVGIVVGKLVGKLSLPASVLGQLLLPVVIMTASLVSSEVVARVCKKIQSRPCLAR